MRILLVGEYSNVHWSLGEGLRALGHDVTVVSDGDSWKNYRRDIDLSRRSTGKFDTLRYIFRLQNVFRNLKGYDIVQIINPMFLSLRASRIKGYYDYLRRHNGKMFLGAFGMDYYWVKTGLDCTTFRYSDFNFGSTPRTEEPFNQIEINDWYEGDKGVLNRYIASDCDGIVAGLYEYYASYHPVFPTKTTFIPFPIPRESIRRKPLVSISYPLKFFIGIQRGRSEYKGTDKMLRALERLKEDYPEKLDIIKVESVPFDEYRRLVKESDILLDQLYSYTPGMNGLLAMSQGVVLVGGGEEEHYELLGEEDLRPIVNVLPSEDDVYSKLRSLLLDIEDVRRRSKESVDYVVRHHDNVSVAQRYLDFWQER